MSDTPNDLVTPADHLRVFGPKLLARYPDDDEVRIVLKALEEAVGARLHWTKDLPTQTGLYWWRGLSDGYPSLVEVWRSAERGLCVDIGDRHRNPVANFASMEWFGPYPFPTEADGTLSKRRGLFFDPYDPAWDKENPMRKPEEESTP